MGIETPESVLPLPPNDQAEQSAEIARLVSLARARDAGAFTELIRRHEKRALATAYAVLGKAGPTGDVVQDAFVRGWERLGELNEPSRFGAWICGIVRNAAIDVRRRSRLEPRSLTTEPGRLQEVVAVGRWAADPVADLSRRERETLLDSALNQLDDISRAAVIYRYYDGLSSKEIGELLGVAATAVDMRISRARRLLKEKLEATGAFTGDIEV